MGKLFGTDGVRGRVGREIRAELGLGLGRAFGAYLQGWRVREQELIREGERVEGGVILGMDTRKSSPFLLASLGAGLAEVGVPPIVGGVLPTGGVSHLVRDRLAAGGGMVTASHNPPEDNGIKFFNREGRKLSSLEEEEVEALYFYFRAHPAEVPVSPLSPRRQLEMGEGYLSFLKGVFRFAPTPLGPELAPLKGWRIGVDPGNGALSSWAPRLYRELGAEVVELNTTPNGENINRNGGALYPEGLGRLISEEGANIGFCFDGDGDRLVVVDERGEVVDGDKVLGGLALFLARHNQLGRGAVATILSNLGLEKFLESHQIPLYRSKVGDREVVTEMERRGAKFGGEQSGHLIFRDYLPTGDGLLSSLFLLRFLIEEGIPASRLHSLFPTYPQLQRSLPIHRKPRLEEIEPLQNLLREIEQGGYRAVVRYSGTEPKVRLLVEGPTLDGVEERIWKLETLLRRELQ